MKKNSSSTSSSNSKEPWHSMDRIGLSVLKKLSPSYLNDLDVATNDGDQENIFLREIFRFKEGSMSCTEQLYYTSIKNRDGSKSVLFENGSGLRELRINVSQSKTKSKSKSKKSSNSSHRTSSIPSLIGCDLSEGYQYFKPESMESIYSLDELFRSIQYLIDEKSSTLSDFKIITLRRNLMSLLLLPVKRKAMRFNIIYWNHLIIIDYGWEFEDRNHVFDKSQFCGFQFEEVMTKPNSVDDDQSEDEILSKLEKLSVNDEDKMSYYSVVKSVIDQIPMLFTAEIDSGIKGNTSGIENYVELKTHSNNSSSSIDLHRPPSFKLQSKLLTTYCQNRLINGQHAVIGFRSTHFRLNSIRTFDTNELGNLINKYPMNLAEDCTLNGGRLFKWFKLIIHWIVQHHDKSTKNTDASTPQVFELEFKPSPQLFESYLKFNDIKSESESRRIFNETVPQWFQTYADSL